MTWHSHACAVPSDRLGVLRAAVLLQRRQPQPATWLGSWPRRGGMSRLLKSLEPLSQYKDRKFDGSLEEYVACLRRSTTVYVGNLAFHTTEEQIHELFSKCGPLNRIIMGLDKNQKTPCGFCFVEYGCRRDTEECVKYLNGARLDERDVRIDFDWYACCRGSQRLRLVARCAARPASLTFRVAAQGISGGPTVRTGQKRRAGA